MAKKDIDVNINARTQGFEDTTRKAGKLDKELRKVSQTTGTLSRNTASAEQSYTKLKRNIGESSRSMESLNTSSKKTATAMQEINTSSSKAASSISEMGKSAKSFGTGGTARSISAVKKELKGMATNSSTAATGLGRIATSAERIKASAGKAATNIGEFNKGLRGSKDVNVKQTFESMKTGLKSVATQALRAKTNIDKYRASAKDLSGLSSVFGKGSGPKFSTRGLSDVTGITSTLDKNFRSLKNSSRDFKTNVNKLSDNAMPKFGTSASSTGGTIAALTGTIAASIATITGMGVAITKAAERLDVMQNKVKLYSKDTAEAVDTFNKLRGFAFQSGVDLKFYDYIYTSVARVKGALGATRDDALRFTDTVTKALAVTGNVGNSATSAIFQLSQGFSSTELRGQELNSVLEQAPEIAKLIADGLGTGMENLRTYGRQGKLTAKAIFDAILSQSDEVAEAFKTAPETITRNMNRLGVRFGEFSKSFNDTTELGKVFHGILQDISTIFHTWDNQLKEGIIPSFEKISDFIGEGAEGFARLTGQTELEMKLSEPKELVGMLRRLSDEMKALRNQIEFREKNAANDFLVRNIPGSKSLDELKEELKKTREQWKALTEEIRKRPAIDEQGPRAANPAAFGGGGNVGFQATNVGIMAQNVMVAGEGGSGVGGMPGGGMGGGAAVGVVTAGYETDVDGSGGRLENHVATNEAILTADQELVSQQAELGDTHRENEIKKEKLTWQMKMGIWANAAGAFADLASTFAEDSHSLFEVSRALAASEAIISAYAAFNKNLAAYPQPFGGIAAAAALATGLAQVNKIRQQKPPGRMFGGPVLQGHEYQVGEHNKPEIFSGPRGQFMIPGDKGRVDPISQGSKAPNITINNMMSDKVGVDIQENSDGLTMIISALGTEEGRDALAEAVDSRFNAFTR